MNGGDEKYYSELIESYHKCCTKCDECLCINNEEKIDYCLLFTTLKGQLKDKVTETITEF